MAGFVLGNLDGPINHGLVIDDTVDFDAIDNIPVDLVFALVVPDEQNDEHLQTLAAIAELLEDPQIREQLRACGSDEDLYRRAVAGA